MSVEEIIAELTAGADLGEVRHFTLDREKAREKLRAYQLADPRHYILELVQAAVARGATQISLEADRDDVHLRFDGDPFTHGDLNELYDAIWILAPSDRLRSRRCLALGLNALMGLSPRQVRLTSSDGESTVRLEARPNSPDRIDSAPREPPGTHIHIKARSPMQVMAELFLRSFLEDVPEIALVAERCRYSQVDIRARGRRVSEGHVLPDAAVTVPIQAPGVSGLGGMYPRERVPGFLARAGDRDRRGYASRMLLLRDGVWITTHALDLTPGCFVALVDAPRLRKDASQYDFVQDEVYADLLRHVGRAHLAAVAELCRARRKGQLPEPDRAWLDSSLGHLLASSFDRQAYERRDPVMRELALAPALQSVSGRPLTLKEIMSWWREDGAVMHGSNAFGLLAAGATKEDLHRVVRVSGRQEEALCERVFAGSLRRASQAFERRKRRGDRVSGDMSEQEPTRLDPGNYLVRVPLHPVGGVEGEVGLLGGPAPESRLTLMGGGRLLEHLEPTAELPGLVAVLNAPLRPGDSPRRVRRDRRLAETLLTVYDAIPSLLATLARRELGDYGSDLDAQTQRRQVVIRLLDLWLSPKGRHRFLDSCRLPPHLVEAVSRGQPAPPQPERVLSALPPELATLPIFSTAAKDLRSLEDLASLHRSGSPLTFLREPPMVDPLPEPISAALVLTARARSLLSFVFGPGSLDDVTTAARRQALVTSPPEQASSPLAAAGLLGVRIMAPRFEAALGLALPDDPSLASETGEFSSLTLLIQGRPLPSDPLHLPLPPARALVTGDLLVGDDRWSGLASLRHLAPVRRALFRAGATLIHQALDPESSWLSPERSRSLALHSLLGIFAQPGLRDLYAQLRKEDRGLADSRIMALLDMGTAWPAEELTQALRTMGEEHIPCAPEALHARLPPLPVEPDCGPLRLTWDASSTWPPPPMDWSAHTELSAVAPLLGLLTGLPELISTVEGTRLSISDLLSLREERGRLLAVDSTSTARDLPGREPVLALDQLDRLALTALMGPEALTPAEPILDRLATRASFLAQPPMEPMELRRSEVLCVVPLKGEVTTGEMGLSRNYYGDAEAELRLHMEHRPLAMRRGFLPFAVVAVANDDRLIPDASFDDAEDSAVLAQVLRLCRLALNPLFERLVQVWPELSSGDREVAWRHALDYLVENSPAEHEEPSDLWRSLARLEGLRGLGGRRHTFGEVARSARRLGLVEYLPFDMGAPAEDPGRPILVLSDMETDRLRRVFDRVEDFSEPWREEQDAASRRRTADPLPRPSRPMASQRLVLESGDLEIHLWLEPGSTASRELVAFGRDGRVLQRRRLSARYPCLGAIFGPAVQTDRSWTRATLQEEHQRQALEVAVRLYRELLYRLEQDELTGEIQQQARLRLWTLCLELHNNKAALSLTERHLLSLLTEAPLAQLDSGEVLPLRRVLEDRPPELEHLGIWKMSPSTHSVAASTGEHTTATPDEDRLLDAIRALLLRVASATPFDGRPPVDVSVGSTPLPPQEDDLPVATLQAGGLVLHREHQMIAWAIAQSGDDPLVAAAVLLRVMPELSELLQVDEGALLERLIDLSLAPEGPDHSPPPGPSRLPSST